MGGQLSRAAAIERTEFWNPVGHGRVEGFSKPARMKFLISGQGVHDQQGQFRMAALDLKQRSNSLKDTPGFVRIDLKAPRQSVPVRSFGVNCNVTSAHRATHPFQDGLVGVSDTNVEERSVLSEVHSDTTLPVQQASEVAPAARRQPERRWHQSSFWPLVAAAPPTHMFPTIRLGVICCEGLNWFQLLATKTRLLGDWLQRYETLSPSFGAVSPVLDHARAAPSLFARKLPKGLVQFASRALHLSMILSRN